MKNPFTKLTSVTGKTVNVNLAAVQTFYASPDDKGTTLTFYGGGDVTISESETTVRNRIKKVWPAEVESTEEA